ncbi:hypothetical protein I302_102387 [Kwoniella bestiolae CBS 10118]|uniref:Arrestin-like N-terminal domain-containing protein n=1 Tax=Kwoniella bestiolae CBS 10118 TaxID=1296100 RepID=A0AAJ8K3L4_9TREE
MSRPELPHTITSHPFISISFDLAQHHDVAQGDLPTFHTGEDLVGVLQLECTVAHTISLGRIEVELVGREHATTQQEVIQKIFWQTSLAFQGPSLPISNACEADSGSSTSSSTYHPARKGITTFPIRLSLPTSLPPLFLHSDCSHFIHLARSCVEVTSTNGWAVEGSRSRIGLRVINQTRSATLSLVLTVIQRIIIRQDDGREAEMDNIVHDQSYSDSHITSAFSESVLYLDFTIPKDVRTVSASAQTSLRVDIFIQVDVGLAHEEEKIL